MFCASTAPAAGSSPRSLSHGPSRYERLVSRSLATAALPGSAGLVQMYSVRASSASAQRRCGSSVASAPQMSRTRETRDWSFAERSMATTASSGLCAAPAAASARAVSATRSWSVRL